MSTKSNPSVKLDDMICNSSHAVGKTFDEYSSIENGLPRWYENDISEVIASTETNTIIQGFNVV